ncbi:hypothetical protein GBAR_LOCUS17807 [Geodia barretti]|uniref:Uncharacterized protein n=1 Tax=Geodia barretti TaxID=519541 RepID=A0AA35SLQ0_GEOBA|nr:hypothetical protein GBAR_LOCUS17807 [Geodia barretti]
MRQYQTTGQVERTAPGNSLQDINEHKRSLFGYPITCIAFNTSVRLPFNCVTGEFGLPYISYFEVPLGIVKLRNLPCLRQNFGQKALVFRVMNVLGV